MKVPFSWLKEYVEIDLTAVQLADRLALTGTEVERVAGFGVSDEDDNLARIVIGQISSFERHPNADKLSVCQVDVGDRRETIVCGASNFQAGDKVAVCLPGGILPGGRKLGVVKLRGVESHGMLCSEAELGLAAQSEGIMILPADLPVGSRLVEHIAISDKVLELEVTPNRPDCLSIYGVAREVAAVTGRPLAPEPVADIEPQGQGHIDEVVSVEVADGDLCPRYGARLIRGVKVAPSPAWLKARIAAAGMRPVNNVVDITNYVMWLLGEPMHAFDLRRIAGGRLIVRRAQAGETITTIDGVKRQLTNEMLVIADAEKPTALAGIMGSEGSEVADDTSDILLEAANFFGTNVMQTSMALGLRSESSTRFEKGLDANLVPQALALASRLMVELCGGRLVAGQIDIYPAPRSATAVHLRPEKLAGLLGIAVPAEETVAILERLGFAVKSEGGALHVTVPSFRADVEREVDLIEEVSRVFGLDLLPPSLPSGMRALGGLSPFQRRERELALSLAEAGLNEIITYTFIAPGFAERLRLAQDDRRRRTVTLANPLSVEQSVMRTLMLPSLLTTAAANLALRNEDVNIFELGRVYLPQGDGGQPQEKRVLAGCLCGSLKGESWLHGGRPVDYFTGKGIVESLFAAVKGSFSVRRSGEPFLHPGKAAEVMVGGQPAGYIGEVHPLVLEAYEIERPLVAFEIDESLLIGSSAGITLFEDLITFPASFQDVAVVVDQDVNAAEVTAAIEAAGAPLLRSTQLFDVYTGEQVGEGKKSIALRIEFRSSERTLTDEEVNAVREAIVASLAQMGASLRA